MKEKTGLCGVPIGVPKCPKIKKATSYLGVALLSIYK